MKKGGLTAEAVEAKLRELNGNLAAVGRHFGVTRQSVHGFIHKRPKLLAAADDCRESMKDHAESALHAALLRGEAWAVCFYLKCQAKDRGYVERSELTGKDGGPVQFTDLSDDDLDQRIAELERGVRRGPGGEGPAQPLAPPPGAPGVGPPDDR